MATAVRHNKLRKVLIRMLYILLAILLLVIAISLINSPGKLKPLRDAEGNMIEDSISEKVWLDVGGIKQGMFIRGENPENPVILYVHGGPGTPLLQFIEYLEKDGERLEKDFTVCYWDQRGAGMTYQKNTDPSTMTVEQMIEDTREVTEYLQTRFGQEKIYLIGHSWGSYLGVKTIEKYPENYLAYIGIGQISDQTQSERLAYAYTLGRAKELGDQSIVKTLEGFDPNADDFPSLEYLVKGRTSVLNKYGAGHLHAGVTFREMAGALFVFKGYTIPEKVNWLLGADFSMIHLFPVVLSDNLFESSPKVAVPFYIAQGDHDYMVSQVLAKEYFDAIDAPKKEYFAFADSAHSPNMEEPEKFIDMMRQIARENPSSGE